MITIIQEFFASLFLSALVIFGAFLLGYVDLRIIGLWTFWIIFLFSLFVQFVNWLIND